MIRIRSFFSAALFAVVVASVAAGAVYAQGGPLFGRGGRGPGGFGGPGGPGGLPLRQLNLSETQQQQVRDVMRQYQEQNRQAAEQLRTAMAAQRAALDTMPVNEGLIRSTTPALAEAQTELAIQQARMQSEIFALLTPSQQEQARKSLAERQTRLQQQRERREQRQAQPRQQ